MSNLNKIILFLKELRALKIIEETISGRRVRRPVVEYDRIEVKLRA